MVEIATSLLSIDKQNIIKDIYDLEVAGTDYFHIDVMDGKFVKNNTTDVMMEYTEYIKQVSNTKIEVHLMVENVEEYVKQYIDMDVDCIMFHIESFKTEDEIFNMINEIKDNNVKVGITLNPDTDIEKVYKFIPYIHRILIMSVVPGEGGQEFIQESVSKIEKLKQYINKSKNDIDIEVDGGINDITAEKVMNTGANILVVGSYICKSDNYAERIQKIKDRI